MTTYDIGEQFIASSSVQGMTAGRRYTVLDLHKNTTAFGTFVAYVVAEDSALRAGTAEPFAVMNLHLLSTPAPKRNVHAELEQAEKELREAQALVGHPQGDQLPKIRATRRRRVAKLEQRVADLERELRAAQAR